MTSTVASVSVNVDPSTAFAAFTEEMDLWWVRGPINYYDAARAVGMRCEPGIGGRIVEVYDQATGEGLELARITVWEPGRRLAWKSSRDDVAIEVRFLPTPGGAVRRNVEKNLDAARRTACATRPCSWRWPPRCSAGAPIKRTCANLLRRPHQRPRPKSATPRQGSPVGMDIHTTGARRPTAKSTIWKRLWRRTARCRSIPGCG